LQMAEKANIERRIVPAEDGELRIVRDDSGAAKLVGYAAVFNRDSVDLGGFIEQKAPGAFRNALKISDVRALKNHDPNLVLGRTPKTLRLAEDKRGLGFEADLPGTTTGKDIAEEVARGDITGCSFAFITKTEQWEQVEGGPDKRTIMEVEELFDVGPVTYPAYPDTTVAARSLEEFRKQRKADESEPQADAQEEPSDEPAEEPAAEPSEEAEPGMSVEDARAMLDKCEQGEDAEARRSVDRAVRRKLSH